MTGRRFFVFVFLAAASVTQCVDTSPLAFEPKKDGGTSDAGPADAAVIQSCKKCLTDANAPCSAEYGACAKLVKCPPTLECLLDRGCFESSAIENRISCGLPCLNAQGVLSGNDPTTQALGQINACIASKCSQECFVK